MREAHRLYTQILKDPQSVRRYVASAVRREQGIGRIVARRLADQGFKRGRVLDAGIGSGKVAVELARTFSQAEVVGLNLSRPFLNVARGYLKREEAWDRALLKLGDIQAMPFKDGCFDVVVSVNTLHVIDDPVAMLDEIERVLAPDGILLISDIKRSWLSLFKPALKMAYTPAEVQQLLDRSQLRPCRFHNHLLWFALEAVGTNGAGSSTGARGNGQNYDV